MTSDGLQVGFRARSWSWSWTRAGQTNWGFVRLCGGDEHLGQSEELIGPHTHTLTLLCPSEVGVGMEMNQKLLSCLFFE